MRKVLSSLFILVLLHPAAHAQFFKYSNDFLEIGVGARGMAMSGAQVATVDDVTAGYWNPAGLYQVKDNVQVAAMHSEYFAGIAAYDYLAFAKPINNDKVLGLSIIRFGVDNIPNTLFLVNPDGSLNYDNITSFSVANYAFMGSFASGTPVKGLHWGVTGKVVYNEVGTFAHSWGFGADAGAQYEKNNWCFGLMLKDITTTFNAWSFDFTSAEQQVLAETGNEIPKSSTELTAPQFILGAGYKFKFGKKVTMTPELDFDMTTDGERNVLVPSKFVSIDPRLGVEASYMGIVYLRAGVGNIQSATDDITGKPITIIQPNAGIGLKIKRVTIDYALTNVGNFSSSLYSQVFSLKLAFGATKKT